MNQPGRMKLLLISLHFSSLCTLSSWSVSLNTVNVRQTTDFDAFEGEAVTISCCWTGWTRVRVTWFKNQATIKNDSFLTNPLQETQKDEMEKCSFWNFDSIKKQDSGRYDCEIIIEIPELIKVRGNGTIITVATRENQTNTNVPEQPTGLPVSIVASVAVASLLLLITLACFCCLRKNKGSGGAARVIHQSPYTNSDISDMDNHSTSSSRGSSQWCQVPVYDSLDYFEHVENKERE
ncbi:uncharacterized protein LOC101156774 [Oryzias latipes]|uniref:uncharacterized protein LOC101156774 n=1 Tax=Oryzias latipes TaxID=8090 RepID=UPI0005CBF58B|nr:uncharacterized protein LOC101156774 [Oryzias latipes]XP_020567445.1 uncharacterized protein LOC101156774 [Oryzias latipes]